MRSTQTFVSSAAPTTANGSVGSTVAIANPTAAASAAAVPAGTALLIQNTGGQVSSLRFAADASFAPRSLSLAGDVTLNPGGQLLFTDPVKLAAAYVLVEGTLALTPGTVATTLTINS